MGDCKYCGKAAGFLKTKHQACEEMRKKVLAVLPELFRKALVAKYDPIAFREKFDQVAKRAWIYDVDRKTVILKGLEIQAQHILDDHILTAEEETQIANFQKAMGIGLADLSDTGFQRALVQAALLRDLDQGRVNRRVRIDRELPFVLDQEETVLWAFPQAEWLEPKTRTTYVGGSVGVSVRIAKGVYVRSSSFRGEPIQKATLTQTDIGVLAISDKNLRFAGSNKTLRLSLKKVISINAFSDAIVIGKDGASTKPHTLAIDDPAFAANLLSRLVARALES